MCGVRHSIVWRSPRSCMAFAAASCGIRHIVVWHSPHDVRSTDNCKAAIHVSVLKALQVRLGLVGIGLVVY